MVNELLTRARAGDDAAFGELIAPYHRELHAHCYRMLGSLQDAEDTLQDTLLAAWRGLDSFAGRASLRTWLYRIATNQCLNARRAVRRRPAQAWDVVQVEPPSPTALGKVVWLQPCPDVVLETLADPAPGPEARYERSETVSLAFVAALQLLPPRQLAVLVLRDVMGFPTDEVAWMLDASADAVKGALKRARATLRDHQPAAGRPAPAAGSPAEDVVVARFVRAWETADLAGLVALFTDDVFLSMPPTPLEYRGLPAATEFCAAVFRAGRRFRLVPTRANSQPAFGAYLLGADGGHHAAGLYVLTLHDRQISAMACFESALFTSFGLPRSFAAATSH